MRKTRSNRFRDELKRVRLTPGANGPTVHGKASPWLRRELRALTDATAHADEIVRLLATPRARR